MADWSVLVETVDDVGSSLSEPLEVEFQSRRWGSGHRFSMDGFTGGHLLHLAVAGCVFNDLLREAQSRGITLTNVSVSADGDYQLSPFESTGISYRIKVEGSASEEELSDLVAYIEEIAEIPAALRKGADVRLEHYEVVAR